MFEEPVKAFTGITRTKLALSLILLMLMIVILVSRLAKFDSTAQQQALFNIRKSDLTSLIVYDGPDKEKSELMTARYIANLLGHFGIKPEIVRASDYSAGQLAPFSVTFVIGSDHLGPLPQALIKDIAISDKPVCWLDRNIEQVLAEPGIAEKFGFQFEKDTDLGESVSVVFKGKSLPKEEGLINIVSVNDPSKAEVLAIAKKDEISTPYVIRSGSFWYFADAVFSYTIEADKSLVFCELLHDILGQQHKSKRYALVRIEDVNPESNPEQLRAVADVMASRGIPFQVALIPIYKNTTRRVEIYLSDRPRVVEALKYMVSRGGSIILHGVTHQLRGNSSDDFEFWDALTDSPAQDSSVSAVAQKLELGMEECFRSGLYPITWETPHYTASMTHYRSLQHFFSHAYDRRLVANDRKTLQYFPYEVEDIYGQSIIPENLGYVNLEEPDPDVIVDGAERMLCVRDSIPSFFFHPFVPISHLKTVLDGIQHHGYKFISAAAFGCSLSVSNYTVSTVPGTVRVEASQPFSRVITINAQGQTLESYKNATEAKMLEEELIPPPGGLIAVQNVPKIPGRKPKTPLKERIQAWWNDTDIQSIPFPKQIARRALLVVNPPYPNNSEPVDIRSFSSFLGVYGVQFERVNAASFENQKLSDDCVVFVPRSVADSLTESGRKKLAEWVHDGGRLVLEGRTILAENIGFSYEKRKLSVISPKDMLYPEIDINWNHAVEMERFDSPLVSTVLVEDTESGKPIVVASRYGNGLVVYLGTDLDRETGMGYTRFPFLFYHLRNSIRLVSPVTAHGTEFYFDPGYRQEAPLEKLVTSWRADGIRAIYAAAWHVYPQWKYDYEMLIRMCHERGIAVYAWFEFPQVCDKLWVMHPEWREKTATGKDGQVGWRKQMNLANDECRSAALDFFAELLTEHDWDGVNIAELSFDTNNGLRDPNGYVPMNNDVREDFKMRGGFDPILLVDKKSRLYWQKNSDALRKWEKYRTQLLNEWLVAFLDRLDALREKHNLDCIVTTLDSLHTPRITEKTGADTLDVIALMDHYDFTLQVEDPIEMWGEIPNRYSQFAETYKKLVKDTKRLMFDINVVTNRESKLAPTKLPTGTELALTVSSAAKAGNGRVAIYSEASLQQEDRSLLPFVLGSTAGLSIKKREIGYQRMEEENSAIEHGEPDPVNITTEKTVRLSLEWEAGKEILYLGPGDDPYDTSYRMEREHDHVLLLNNEPWPGGEEGEVLIPAGEHALTSEKLEGGLIDRFGLGLRIKDVTAEVENVSRTSLGISFDYLSPRRAWAVLNRDPKGVYLDGIEIKEPIIERYGGEFLVQLPSGKHKVGINDETTASVVVDIASVVSSRSAVWLGGKFVLILVILFAAVRMRKLMLILGTKMGP